MSVKELKIELKTLAVDIHNEKNNFKDFQRKHCGSGGSYHLSLSKLQYECRHKHIAYCQLRGRKYEEIESKCTRVGDPNWNYIKEIIDANQETPQDVRACA